MLYKFNGLVCNFLKKQRFKCIVIIMNSTVRISLNSILSGFKQTNLQQVKQQTPKHVSTHRFKMSGLSLMKNPFFHDFSRNCPLINIKKKLYTYIYIYIFLLVSFIIGTNTFAIFIVSCQLNGHWPRCDM